MYMVANRRLIRFGVRLFVTIISHDRHRLVVWRLYIGLVMNNNPEPTEMRLLNLAILKDAGVEYLTEAAALIRDLPSVHRVYVDSHRFLLEILYTHPSHELLRDIHRSLRAAEEHLIPA